MTTTADLSATRVRIYLDVDGVLNAQAPSNWGGVSEGYATAEGSKYRMRWAPALLEALSALDADIVWTTTWRTDAADSLATLFGGFGQDFRVLHPNLDPHAETTFPSIYWKLAAIAAEQAASPSPFVWLDDEIDLWEAKDAGELGGLALTINAFTGITPAIIEKIEAYIAR